MSLYSDEHDETVPEDCELLLPTYKPDWGRVHLNGELDFDPEATLEEIEEDFRDRAPEIGALIRRNGDVLECHPGMAASTYFLIPGDDGTVKEIWTEVSHKGEKHHEHAEMDRLIDICSRMKEIVDEAVEKGNLDFVIQKRNR